VKFNAVIDYSRNLMIFRKEELSSANCGARQKICRHDDNFFAIRADAGRASAHSRKLMRQISTDGRESR
jgi:hypothetical protein